MKQIPDIYFGINYYHFVLSLSYIKKKRSKFDYEKDKHV